LVSPSIHFLIDSSRPNYCAPHWIADCRLPIANFDSLAKTNWQLAMFNGQSY
jgi:hypothetical protein